MDVIEIFKKFLPIIIGLSLWYLTQHVLTDNGSRPRLKTILIYLLLLIYIVFLIFFLYVGIGSLFSLYPYSKESFFIFIGIVFLLIALLIIWILKKLIFQLLNR